MILVTGGTGFVGRHLVHHLRAEDKPVRCLVRRPDRAHTLRSSGCELVEGDVTDAASLRRAVDGCDAVIHLVAIIAGSHVDFERIMEQGTRDLVAAAREADVRRFVHMSALSTSERTKDLVPYYHAKWESERAVKASGLEHVVFRPSFVFGADGGALPLFMRQVRWSPVTPVVGDGTRRLQPIWVEDIAAFFAAGLDHPGAANRTFELGGPEQLTWNELYERIARALGKHRARINLPIGLVRAGATVAQRLPKPPITRDQLTMLLAADSVCDMTSTLDTFGIPLTPLDEQLRRAA